MAIGKYKLGLASVIAFFIAAGTAIYDAPAPKIEKSNWFPGLSVNYMLKNKASNPLKKGIIIAKANGKTPFLNIIDRCFPLVIPISSKNTAKKPLKISVVKGAIPSACLALAKKPI